MDSSGYVAVARVVKPHGLAGEVAVLPATAGPFGLRDGITVWFVPPPAGPRSGTVEGVRPGPKGPLLKVSGIDSIDAARSIAGCTVLALSDDVPEIADAALSEFDPVGLRVTDVVRGDLGEIEELIVTGANDVWVVRGPLGEVLIPVIDDVVIEIDEEDRTVSVRLLPGLLPDDAEEA